MPHVPVERLYYITPDGAEYQFHDPGMHLLIQQDGTGMPPIEYLTQRGPFQHGESLKGFHLRPRVIELLIRSDFCSRTQYWQGRGNILTMLNPARQTLNSLELGTLRQILSNGQYRDINCLVQEGPGFTPHDRGVWDEWAFTDIIRFMCFDPTYFNPSIQSVGYTVSSGGELVFPITFPIQFSAVVSGALTNITYVGNWLSFPTITITGPVDRTIITNEATGFFIDLNTPVGASEVITIDLSYGQKTVIRDDGTNMIGFITPESNLSRFAIEPHPVATDGVNPITISAPGSGGTTSVVLTWYDRYIGLGL